MSKIDWKTVGKSIGNVFWVAVAGLLVSQSIKNDNYVLETKVDYGATCSDAIGAIMESDMWDNDKERAVTLLDKHGTTEYYKSIIKIANSDMWSSSKLRSIANLS